MALRFRNLTVTPADPVEDWGFEGLLTAVDRGDLGDWHRIMSAVRRDPWGDVSQALIQALDAAEDSGVVGALRAALQNVRDRAERDERAEVVETIHRFLDRSGMGKAEFARRVGTSASRMSTYLSGKTVPSAVMLVRMSRVASGRTEAPLARWEPGDTIEFLPPFAGG